MCTFFHCETTHAFVEDKNYFEIVGLFKYCKIFMGSFTSSFTYAMYNWSYEDN